MSTNGPLPPQHLPEVTYRAVETTEMYLDGELVTSTRSAEETFASDEMDDITKEQLLTGGIQEATLEHETQKREVSNRGWATAAVGTIALSASMVLETDASGMAGNYRGYAHAVLLGSLVVIGLGLDTIRRARSTGTPLLRSQQATIEKLETLQWAEQDEEQ
jgi:hypothetical protein